MVCSLADLYIPFQHTATRRWLPLLLRLEQVIILGFNTQPPEGGCGRALGEAVGDGIVSTHSHPKVAAEHSSPRGSVKAFQHTATRRWLRAGRSRYQINHEFQHTATRRWLPVDTKGVEYRHDVSTHSHPKVAAHRPAVENTGNSVSTHSHPKVAAENYDINTQAIWVSTHSHPKVAADANKLTSTSLAVSTHSHPKVAAKARAISFSMSLFQHTATRRWLRRKYRLAGGL